MSRSTIRSKCLNKIYKDIESVNILSVQNFVELSEFDRLKYIISTSRKLASRLLPFIKAMKDGRYLEENEIIVFNRGIQKCTELENLLRSSMQKHPECHIDIFYWDNTIVDHAKFIYWLQDYRVSSSPYVANSRYRPESLEGFLCRCGAKLSSRIIDYPDEWGAPKNLNSYAICLPYSSYWSKLC